MTVCTVEQMFERAHHDLNVNSYGGGDGKCQACGASECQARESAVTLFSRYAMFVLPSRLPGASRPERLGLRRVNPGPTRRPDRLRPPTC